MSQGMAGSRLRRLSLLPAAFRRAAAAPQPHSWRRPDPRAARRYRTILKFDGVEGGVMGPCVMVSVRPPAVTVPVRERPDVFGDTA